MPETKPPPPVAPVPPFVAVFIMGLIPPEKWRSVIDHARKNDSPMYARQMEQSRAYLNEGVRWWRAEADAVASEVGSTEVVGAEVAADSERPDSLDTTAVAGLLGRTPRRVRMLCETERLSATRLAGRWVIDRAAVDEYLMRTQK
jgi:hypothetical protein